MYAVKDGYQQAFSCQIGLTEKALLNPLSSYKKCYRVKYQELGIVNGCIPLSFCKLLKFTGSRLKNFFSKPSLKSKINKPSRGLHRALTVSLKKKEEYE